MTEVTFVTNRQHQPRNVKLNFDMAQEVLAYWAQVLKLTDWVIDLEMQRGYKIGGTAWARCRWTASKRRATVFLLHPDDADPDDDPMDMEAAIVHELLHIYFAPVCDWIGENSRVPVPCPGVVDDYLIEQPIERLSWVLVCQRRENPEKQMPWDRIKYD